MRLTIKITVVLAFIILMFLHVTEPKINKVHKHHRLKVVFGGKGA